MFDFTFINDYDIQFQRSKSNIHKLFVYWYLNGCYLLICRVGFRGVRNPLKNIANKNAKN